MPIEVRAYECQFYCGKMYRAKNTAKRHERQCYWNPGNRACASCGNQDNERFCIKTGADLNINSELRHNCDLWSAPEVFIEATA